MQSRSREKYAKKFDKVQGHINTCSSADECKAVVKKLKQWKEKIRDKNDELTAKIRNEGIDLLTGAHISKRNCH
ncbi:hypothetical protein [Enterobacter quasiroggenkampii]|uniref:hypothetical protein n=1 Tax=Enterobacter quasiroggenkampii TaxID=2497436 RepID=UPI0038796D2C